MLQRDYKGGAQTNTFLSVQKKKKEPIYGKYGTSISPASAACTMGLRGSNPVLVLVCDFTNRMLLAKKKEVFGFQA